jgi:uncharacterized protein (TIGR01244 family)
MEIRELVPGYAVSPQIETTDVPALAAAGFTVVINNRPDAENPPERSAAEMRRAVEAAGMTFVDNPLSHGNLTHEIIDLQRQTLDQAKGPVFAYCASGNRCSVIWAHAMAHDLGPDKVIAAAARWGYRLEPYRAVLQELAEG